MLQSQKQCFVSNVLICLPSKTKYIQFIIIYDKENHPFLTSVIFAS